MNVLIDAKFLTHPQVGGFKTYVEGLVRGIAAVDDNNHYVLCVDRAPIRTSGLPKGRNIRFMTVRSRIPIVKEVIREQIGLAWAARLAIDLLHFPCNTAPLLASRPYVLTLHDVLALKNPYFRFSRPLDKSLWAFAQSSYQSTIIPRVAKRARYIITVSEYEKRQIVDRLDVVPEKVRVVYLAVDPRFTPPREENREVFREQLRNRFGISGRYIISVGSKPSKNIPGLVRAYASLRSVLSDPPELALVMPHSVTETAIRSLAQQLGIETFVRFLPGLPQSELVGLYGLAEAFVFPSFRESFGLPPLEAMACGTPVVAAKSSCLPEVVGDAALLVDPNRDCDIAGAIRGLLENPDLASRMRTKGLEHVKKYSWENTAGQTVEVYRRALERDRAERT